LNELCVKSQRGLYDCRHIFASRAVENGVYLLILSQIPGHNGLKTISRYARSSESYKPMDELLAALWTDKQQIHFQTHTKKSKSLLKDCLRPKNKDLFIFKQKGLVVSN